MNISMNGKQITLIIYCVVALIVVAVAVATISWSNIPLLLIILFSALGFAAFLTPLVLFVIAFEELADKQKEVA